ncbi:MAG: hypothetical protein M3Z09_16100 [Acidobacteriota bacterium]|nr:hypothetical protein [Acidobacteriota bacterium]
MIWLWLIGFNYLAGAEAPSVVTGRVELRDSRELSVRKGSDYSGVIVSLEPVRRAAPSGSTPPHARMLQKDKMFQPHLLPVEAGTAVDFPNADPIFHNAFSSYSGQIFDVGLYPPRTSRTVRFTRPGVVRVFCNIHPTMSAVIVVLDTPYFAVTDRQGAYEITVPQGDYIFHVYHERATEEHLRLLSHPIHVEEGHVDLPVTIISESGYLPSPHKNKYGLDYRATTDDLTVYPGVRK